MTAADLDRLTAAAQDALARADAATEGPWRDGPMGDVESDDGIAGIWVAHDVCDSDRAFIAAARSDVPALARAVLDLAAEVRHLRADLDARATERP